MPNDIRHKRASVATIFAALVVGAGAVKEILIARTFGVSEHLDLYLLVSAMPLAIVSLFGNSWQSAATPELAETEAVSEGQPYLRVVRLIALPIALVCTVIALATSYDLVPQRVGLGTISLYIGLLTLSVGLGLLSAGWYPLALIGGRPNLVVVAPAIVHLGIALGVIALDRSPLALYGGLLLGHVALYVGFRTYGMHADISRTFSLNYRTFRRILRNLGAIAAGGAAMALALPIDLLFASHVTSGGPSIVNYATRVPLAASVVGASVIGTVAFADLVAVRSDRSEMSQHIGRWISRSAVFGGLAAGLVWVLSKPIIQLLFASERLTGSELVSVIEVQQVAALHILPFLVSVVLVRSFNAIGINLPLLWISLANLAINIVGNWLLAPMLGLAGIMLSTAFMYMCSSLFLWLTWHRVTYR